MYLALLAAGLHGLAYAIYLHQVYSSDSVPNPSSWTVWALLASLNAITYWKASEKDTKMTAQFITGSVASILVWTYALAFGKFSAIDEFGWVTLVLCVVASKFWYDESKKRNAPAAAARANILIALILAISSIPTLQGVWQDKGTEHALPWFIWTLAFAVSTINVTRRWAPYSRTRWRLLVMPVTGILLHLAVAVLAIR